MSKKISWVKIALNTLLLAGVFTSCTMLQMGNKTQAAAKVKAEVVQEYHIDTMPITNIKTTELSVPLGDTSFKSYMDYRAITNTRSMQYKLQSKCWTDDNGLRRYNDDYVIAVGSYYSNKIGTRLLITLSTGVTFTATVGDFKADCHTDSTNRYTDCGGGKNVIEFIVDTKTLSHTARKMGDVSFITGFDGDISKIEVIE